MNYEQKYKEALEQAKTLHKMAADTGYDNTRMALEHIFPQLRESEDERIRKRIVWLLNSYIGKWDYPETKEECLVWLEKHKEQPNLELIQQSWYMDGYIDGEFKREPRWNLKAGKRGPRYEKNEKCGQLLEQKEQKPAEKQDYSGLNDLERAILRGFLAAGVENVPVTIIKETAKECLTQQKPAEWSEEDERMLSRCVKSIESSKQFADSDTFNKAKDREIDWLENRFKSLLPQPKQEWSEEDEKMNKEIRLYLKQDRTDFPGRAERINKMIEWLINICPNSQWKPSEEQMKILNWAANGMVDKSIAAPEMRAVLRELYEQLKKLM